MQFTRAICLYLFCFYKADIKYAIDIIKAHPYIYIQTIAFVARTLSIFGDHMSSAFKCF